MRSALVATWDDDGPDDGHGWDAKVMRYELIEIRSAAEVAQALAVAEAILAPASECLALAELARVRVMTASRDIGLDLQMALAAFVDELMRYPADAVTEVLREWPRTQRFWPTMAELTERLERLVRPRRALCDALRRGYQPPQTSPDWIPPTADEKEAVAGFLVAHGIVGDPAPRERAIEAEPMTARDRQRVADELARRPRIPLR